MLCESNVGEEQDWVSPESLPSPNTYPSFLEMLWFLWVCCCTMQKLKGKSSNSVDIHTGHFVFAKKLQFWWFSQNGLPMRKLLWVDQSLTAGDMTSNDTSGGASVCSEHFNKLPCSQAIQLHEVWLLSQEVCDVMWVLCKIECHGLEECEEEEANSLKISWAPKSFHAGVRCGV